MGTLRSGAPPASQADNELLARSVVDGLSARVAVIGGSGEIVFVNEAWRSFARANGGDPARVCEGADYLGACDSATGTYSEGAAEFAAGVREVLAGRRGSFELEYPCPGPDGTRWFVARVTRLPAAPLKAVVAHEDVTDRRRYERERLRSRTSKAAARARAHEQRRVGRELHDRVAHLMGVVHQSLELHEALKGRDPGKAAERMALARRATKEAMAATRDLSQALGHAEAGEGLGAALSGLLRETVPPGVAHELSVSDGEEAIPDEAREQLFLVLREAVRNAVSHSGAAKVVVSVGVGGGRVLGAVEDDGRGFDLAAAEGGGSGGLAYMAERASLLGGTCSVDLTPGVGTRVAVDFPAPDVES
jgi:signal transduction histidine kinase